MYITSMRIQNYRNFKDITMAFHPLANYLVGENDIGKSGFLRLLSFMASAWTLPEIDYYDPKQPIRITLALHLLEGEEEYCAGRPSPGNPGASGNESDGYLSPSLQCRYQ